ncbi:PREDICTED: sialic acid-binding Ig-like lectin 6-like [Elephantulus edwardii]|uniref:sialic acid-binding Ig-like lectin 6-like n=1 Tax=Elephantulus edwardii TaxID=28737 RepID=UPI0003F0F05D|nr:PREDICTED: sialic acid-binding Ig-like lectin 6-like [Elephantulus edwardii]
MLLLLLSLLWEGILTQRWPVELELQESATVQEGLCLFVPCKFHPQNPYLSTRVFLFQKGVDLKDDALVATNRQPVEKLQERTQGRFLLPWTSNCSLIIRDAKKADSGTYLFWVGFSYNRQTYGKKTLSLNVTALTQSPSIQVPAVLASGHPRNLTCTVPWACEQGTPPLFSWTSAALTSPGPRTYLSSVLTLSPRPQDHGTSLTCQVTFPAVGVTMKTTILLNVSYAPQNVAIGVLQGNNTALQIVGNASSLIIPEGQSVHLHCTADSNPPPKLAWFQGSPARNTSPFSSTGYVALPHVGMGEKGVIACQAQNQLGSQHVLLNLSVQSEFGIS